MQMFMKRCVAAESGAPPESSTRMFPPKSARTRLNTRLREKYDGQKNGPVKAFADVQSKLWSYLSQRGVLKPLAICSIL